MAPYDEGGGSFVPPSATPRRVRGGIRLQSRTGGSSWWARRWLAAFEAGAVGERHKQGLDDARRGQVLDVHVELGRMVAHVQGARSEPHEVIVSLGPIEQPAWLRVAQAIAERGASRAELLAGQMPDDVEAAFRREGASLFPQLDDDLESRCSCEDWAVPCRHALAAALVLSESMDADPMLAFRLRGIEPDLLRALVTGIPVDGQAPGAAPDESRDVARGTAASAVDPDRFWTGAAEKGPAILTLDPPRIDAPLVRILGAPPMWRGADTFEPAMRRLYAHVASDPRTIDLALGVRLEN